MATIGTRLPGPYNYEIVKRFLFMSLLWGLVGSLAGLWIAGLLVWPDLGSTLGGNAGLGFDLRLDLPELSYGRLRPVHTNLLLFGFIGNALFASAFYIVQRTCQTRLAAEGPAAFGFWGWQLVVGLGSLSLLLGHSQGREYAEFEWPLDILATLVWLAFLASYIATLMRRNQPHIYVANWFLLAFLLVSMLVHIADNLALPLDQLGLKSYSLLAGTEDAMVHWWYGENVVGFFLGAALFGVMYYFLPKQAGRPLYSYRLSIVHFWSLCFLYSWVGAIHLHWTALPYWMSILAVGFAILLVLPSLAGVANGLLTLSGAWRQARRDLVLRFLATALVFYAVVSAGGLLVSLRGINALSHYTDWTVAHAHLGLMGWGGLLVFGAFYHLAPRLWGTRLYSPALGAMHYWLVLASVLLYTGAMWSAGWGQGGMLRSLDQYGNLRFSFVESLTALHLPYFLRTIAGGLFLLGLLTLSLNVWLTARRARRERRAIRTKLARKLGAHAPPSPAPHPT